MATVKLLSDLAAISWTGKVPNSKGVLSSNFDEALLYLAEIAKLVQERREQESESAEMIKKRCWEFTGSLQTGEYLKAAAICSDLGVLPEDKPAVFVFQNEQTLEIPSYVRDYLGRESTYFASLFSGGFSKPLSIPLSVRAFTLILQHSDASWMVRRLNLSGVGEVKDLEYLQAAKVGEDLGLRSLTVDAVESVQKWKPDDINAIARAQAWMAEPCDSRLGEALKAFLAEASKEGNIQKILEGIQDLEEFYKALQVLMKLSVKKLVVPGRFLNEETIQWLNQFDQLDCLVVTDRTEVEDLCGLQRPSLKEIRFINCQNVSKKVLEHFAPQLSSLCFEGCGIKDIHLTKLRSYQLKELFLINCPHLSSSGLSHLYQLPLLKLHLINCFEKEKDPVGFVYLPKFKSLEEMKLDHSGVSITRQFTVPGRVGNVVALAAKGCFYTYEGKNDKALEFHTQELAAAEAAGGKDHLSAARALSNMARSYYRQGQYDQALELHRQALKIREGKDELLESDTLHHMARCLFHLERYDDALEFEGRALKIREAKLEKDHFDIGESLYNQARCYLEQKDHKTALELYRRALGIARSCRSDVLLSDILCGVGQCHELESNPTEALKFYVEAVELREANLGKDHPSVAFVLRAAGLCYFNLGNFRQAVEFFARELQVYEDRLTQAVEKPLPAKEETLPQFAGATRQTTASIERVRPDASLKGQPEEAQTVQLKVDKTRVLHLMAQCHQELKEDGKALELLARELKMREDQSEQDLSGPISCLKMMVECCFGQSNFESALKYATQELEMTKSKCGNDSVEVGAIFFNMALCHYNQGDTSTALNLLQQSKELCEKHLDENDLGLAQVLDLMAECYDRQSQYVLALKSSGRSQKIKEAQSEPDDLQIAKNLGLQAHCYFKEKKYAEALALYLRQLEIVKTKLDKNDPKLLSIMEDIALCHFNQENYEEALRGYTLLQEATEARRGKNHLDVAVRLEDRADCHFKEGHYHRALKLYQQALSIVESNLGQDHLRVVKLLNEIASCHDKKKKLDEALKVYQRALKIQETELGGDHPDVAASLYKMGECHLGQSHSKDALKCFVRALEIREAQPEHDPEEVMVNLMYISECQYNLGNYQESLKQRLRAHKILEAHYGIDQISAGINLHHMGLCHYKQKEYVEALAHLDRARKIIKDDPFAADTLHYMALCHDEQESTAEALKLHLQALAIRQAAGSPAAQQSLKAVEACRAKLAKPPPPEKNDSDVDSVSSSLSDS